MTRLDSNGYAPSIMETEDGLCFMHKGKCETVRHEIYFGTGNRKVSKANGFWVNICPRCHAYIHANKDTDEELKRECYRVFTRSHSPEDFFRLIGRYYED